MSLAIFFRKTILGADGTQGQLLTLPARSHCSSKQGEIPNVRIDAKHALGLLVPKFDFIAAVEFL